MIARIIYASVVLLFFAGCLMASENQAKEMKLTISHYKVPCSGESIQLCYLIKKDDGKTEFFHDEIEGFEYQWGYNYVIGVEKIIKGKVMADASSFTYKLKKVYKKEKILPGVTFELPLTYEDQHLMESKNGTFNYFGAIAVQTSKYSSAELAKAKTAIFKYSADKRGLVLVSLKR